MCHKPGGSADAGIASWVAAMIDVISRPLKMTSMTEFTPSGNADSTPGLPRSVGQNFSYVLAIKKEYLLPAFEPLLATPPGNGVITPGMRAIAAVPRSAAASAAPTPLAKNQRLPPINPSR